MRQCLNTIEYLKKKKPLPPEPQLPDFYHPSEAHKKVHYYFLQWVQVLEHMLYASILNKFQTKGNIIKHTIILIVFGLVARQ